MNFKPAIYVCESRSKADTDLLTYAHVRIAMSFCVLLHACLDTSEACAALIGHSVEYLGSLNRSS